VNWAVGFGPTQCADYNIGESIIPIDLLTDADRKWMLNAEYGGTGGNPIAQGMVVEEPDIEIGAGPSSKAIHRRGGGAAGAGAGGRGGNFYRGRGGGGGGDHHHHHQNGNSGRYRKPDRPQAHHVVPEANTIGPPPPVPTFGAPIPGVPMNFR
jgi:protein NRD1